MKRQKQTGYTNHNTIKSMQRNYVNDKKKRNADINWNYSIIKHISRPVIVVVQYIFIGLTTNGILLNNLWGGGNEMEVIRFNWNETDTRNALTIYTLKCI